MENDILQSVNEIKTLIYIVLAIVGLGAILITFIAINVASKMAKYKREEDFNFHAQEMLDKNCNTELIEYAKEYLEERPNHTYALWYLAKGHYNLKNYSQAKELFEKIGKTEVSWLETVEPYLNEIKDIQDNTSNKNEETNTKPQAV